MTRHRSTVVVAWLSVVAICGLVAATVPGDIANAGFAVPGSHASQAESLARRYIPKLPPTTLTAVLTSDRPKPELAMEATIAPLEQLQGVQNVEQVTSRAYVNDNNQTETLAIYRIYIALPYAAVERRIPAIEHVLQQSARNNVSFGLLGEAAAGYRYSKSVRQDLARTELIALPITLGMLMIAFLSAVAALAPIVLAAVTLVCTLAIVHLLSLAFGLSVFVINTASAVALGLSVDYSLMIVTRFREERQTADLHRAIARTMQTAGRAVLLSGLTIAALLPALIIVGVPLFTSIALGGIIASLTAVAAAMTLLPATLVLLGDHLDRFSSKLVVEAARRGTFWRRLGSGVTARPCVAALLSAAALLALAVPALSLQLSYSTAVSLPNDAPVSQKERALTTVFGPGAIGPVKIITNESAYDRNIIREDPNERTICCTIEGVQHWVQMSVLLQTAPNSTASRQTVTRLRHEFYGHHTVVAGVTANEMDLLDRVATRILIVVAAAATVALFVLVIGLKSIVIPIKAMVCSALSVAATLGLLHLCFPSSSGESELAFYVPVVTFILVSGLSIDYEVFLLSRIRELVADDYDTASAVSLGLSRTARPITLAGLVVITVFVALAFSSLIAVRQLGLAVSIGVLLDISLVRWVLSPACVVLMGRWNWWLPSGRTMCVRHRR